MIRTTVRRTGRRGVTIVEFAFVCSILLLFIFGLFEYGRFVFTLQVATNAAREGARLAVARTGDGTTKQQIIDEVTRRMSGRSKELQGFTVDVYPVDPNTGTPVSDTEWNDAAFGDAIAVSITGTYHPILPSFLKASTSVPVRITSMMSSEAN
jgi:Flp pilus assembly protein TadG